MKQLQQLEKGRQTVARMIISGKMSESDAKEALTAASAKEKKLHEEVDRNNEALRNLPTPDQIRAISERASELVSDRRGKVRTRASASLRSELQRLNDHDQLSLKEKRALVEEAFTGTMLDGSRMGVYVGVVPGQTNHRHKRWRFKLLGNAVINGTYGRTRCVAESALC
jgi:hypothetical protein